MRFINFGSLNIDKVYQVEQFVRPGQTITAWLRAARGSTSHWRRLERAQRCCTRARSARKAALWPICCGNPVWIPRCCARWTGLPDMPLSR